MALLRTDLLFVLKLLSPLLARACGGFMLACISGRRGVIGFKVATWLCPARDIVRPANEKWHKIGVLWRAGRSFSRMAREGPSSGELVVPRCRARTIT